MSIEIWFKPGIPRRQWPRRGLVIAISRAIVARRAGETFLFGEAPKTGFYAAINDFERLDPIRLKEAGYRVVGSVDWKREAMVWDSSALGAV